jgi:predicted LPLAT superfamily acyltransferase
MLELIVAFADPDAIIPEDTSARIVWAAIAAVILGLYLLTKSARKKAAQDYWDRRKAEEERIANDPDMRKD